MTIGRIEAAIADPSKLDGLRSTDRRTTDPSPTGRIDRLENEVARMGEVVRSIARKYGIEVGHEAGE